MYEFPIGKPWYSFSSFAFKYSDGIFEFRQSDHHKFYRVFAFWDSEERETLIVGTHGFDKKSNKTAPKEIKKAEQIKKRYFNTKNKKR